MLYCYMQGVNDYQKLLWGQHHLHELEVLPFLSVFKYRALPLKQQEPIYSQFFFQQVKEEMQACLHSSYVDNDKTSACHT